MTKDVERFHKTDEAKIIVKLNQILYVPISRMSEDVAIAEDFLGVMDERKVVMVIAKSEEAKRVLAHFVDMRAARPDKPVDADYTVVVDKCCVESPFALKLKGYYSPSLLRNIMDFMDSCSVLTSNGRTLMLFKPDQPFTVDNEHFRIVLAPILYDDDDE